MRFDVAIKLTACTNCGADAAPGSVITVNTEGQWKTRCMKCGAVFGVYPVPEILKDEQ